MKLLESITKAFDAELKAVEQRDDEEEFEMQTAYAEYVEYKEFERYHWELV